MNNLEKYLDQVIEQKPAAYEPPGEIQRPPGKAQRPPEEPPTVNLLASVRRRWYIALITTIVLCAVALPVIWLVIQPEYVVQGAVEVRPVVPGILTNEPSPAGDMGGYGEFVNTQAFSLMHDNVILRGVAETLADRNLAFFSGRPQNRIDQLIALVSPTKRNLDPERILRDAIAKKPPKITATAMPRTNLIAVTMQTTRVEEAKTIVDSFLRIYVAQYGNVNIEKERATLNVLESQRVPLLDKIKNQRTEIERLADEYKTPSLGPLQEMEFNKLARLTAEMVQLEPQKIAAEANVNLLEKTEKVELSPEQVVNLRREYVNSNPMVAELSRSIVEMERDLITQRSLITSHPKLSQEETALENLKEALKAKRQELEKESDSRLEAGQKEAAQQRLAAAKMEQDRIDAVYNKIKDVVDQQDARTKRVGETSMSIQDRQFQLQVDQDQYNTLYRRIQTLEMEQKRPGRIETVYSADMVETNDRRVQLATAAVIGALACGFGLAFLRDRMDKTLQTPEDVTRQLDLPVLGTTTSSRTIKPALFAEQIAGDYQTIRTNLGLMNDGGLPRRLVVSSAGTREGKTTFAVNLATSLAKSGKKVLLIDGDLRKPDVGQMLNVPKDTGYLQDVLLGGDPSGIAYVSPSSGLHVLAANPRHMADPYELLTSSMAAEQIERLTREYDHIIIDSPPALAFPDALVWAKLADAVVLVGLAGQTTGPDLKEAKERFTRGRARVLGAVLSNVPVDQSLYRHAYTYRARSAALGRKAHKSKKLLLASQKPGGNGGTA
jgi:capsular exopolysaccharide synthesis family protein